MNANHPTEPKTTGQAFRSANVAGVIPPGLTLLGFRDGHRLASHDQGRNDGNDNEANDSSGAGAGRVHAAFTGLLAIGTIALLALGR